MESNSRIKTVELVPVKDLKPNPRNYNTHTEGQINRLAALIEYQGFRLPIVVSNRTGLIVAGHGRLSAAKKMGLKFVPAAFQDFESQEQETAFGISDNAIADWAELDMSLINQDIADLGPDFDLDLLGIDGFELEPADKYGEKELDENLDTEHECPKCGYKWS